jgi:hypothetical protein
MRDIHKKLFALCIASVCSKPNSSRALRQILQILLLIAATQWIPHSRISRSSINENASICPIYETLKFDPVF